MLSLTDTLQNKEKCNKVTFSSEYPGVGDCVSLPCNETWKDRDSGCSGITWLFSNNTVTTELVAEGKVKSDDNSTRLRTEDCSLEVKTLRKEDGGQYTCRQYPSSSSSSSSSFEDHARYILGPIRLGLTVGVPLGIAVLLILALVLLIYWSRRRGNKKPKDMTICLSPDRDLDGGPTYASIVLPEGQRAVGTAQVEDGSSDAVTYASVRASPRLGGNAGDVDVHYATVNKRAK
ncbi:hypothetical protein N1851_033221 [Merluccius polli]|uniref:Ig-like domain-containing protein n=1 Tax=Merluccius polli TaxID=89951 RepID=A0AA47M1M2_MERPO|nr:hypothetical protein N1851_033221 [Merluccius polli]